jgi:hypothetical protein
MFNPTQVVINTYVERLKANYIRQYGLLEPDFPDMIAFIGRLALENIADSDAPYHDVNHTIMVTDVGQAILKGRHLSEGGVSPYDWLHVMTSLLCHDIGYVRGVCRGDKKDRFIISEDGETTTVAPGATDAAMTPYHVTRSKIFVKERFSRSEQIDTDVVVANIEHTRFPVPESERQPTMTAYPSLVHAADLIGQMADVHYIRKISALFAEFRETGTAKALGYESADDLRTGYPKFFWHVVQPVIGDAIRHLKVTQEGKFWVASLYAHVFAEEYKAGTIG